MSVVASPAPASLVRAAPDAAARRPIDALLLVSFGGPEGPDDVMPFLERVTRGRGIPRERLEAVSHHYLALGGVSPINAQNRQLLGALRTELDARGIDLPLFWGNRNSEPYIAETLRDIHAAGHSTVLAVTRAPTPRIPAAGSTGRTWPAPSSRRASPGGSGSRRSGPISTIRA